MTAVSAIVFFLGLLFGFQRPSRLLPPRLRATVLLLLGCTPFNLGGCTLYFEAISLSSSRCCLPSSLRPAGSPHRAVALCLFLSRGAEPTSLPLPVSTRFVDSLFFLASAFAASRGGGFYHHRVESQLRSSTSYFVFHCISRRSPSPVRLRLSVRGGAASIASPQGNQPLVLPGRFRPPSAFSSRTGETSSI